MTGIKIHPSFKDHVQVKPSASYKGVRNIHIIKTLGHGFSATVAEPISDSSKDYELAVTFYGPKNTEVYSLDSTHASAKSKISKIDFDAIVTALAVGDVKALKNLLAQHFWLPDALSITPKKIKARPRKIIEQFDLFVAGAIA